MVNTDAAEVPAEATDCTLVELLAAVPVSVVPSLYVVAEPVAPLYFAASVTTVLPPV